MRKLRWFGFLLLVGVLLVAVLLVLNRDRLKRLLIVNSFFDQKNIVDNFQDVDDIFPHSELQASHQALALPVRLGFDFPDRFSHGGTKYQTQKFLKDTQTEGLLVIQSDTIVHEEYRLGLEPSERHISWSMSKSFIGTLIGVAVEQGKLSLEDKVERLLPDFVGTGYEGVTVRDLLGMRSGVLFDEDYGDFNSDINRFGRAFALGTSYREFAQSLQNEVSPGSRCHYVSIDTQMLSYMLTKSMGASLTELMQQYIWDPMGMEHKAGWILDDTGYELALGGLLATLRDFAKLGLLYKNEGQLNGHQIVSKEWIRTATSRHPSQPASEYHQMGYGYQWWIPGSDTGDYMMIGIYDQFVYVNPAKDLIIAKLSADYNFKENGPAIRARHISFFQEVARQTASHM